MRKKRLTFKALPRLREAAKEMARGMRYDEAFGSMDDWLEAAQSAVCTYAYNDLQLTDRWLSKLTPDQLATICYGMEDEAEAIAFVTGRPPVAIQILLSIFEADPGE